MGSAYPMEIEFTSKPRAEYESDEYAELDLPCAPAIMIDDDVLVEGGDISEDKLVAAIRGHLGMDPLEPQKKGILDRLLGK